MGPRYVILVTKNEAKNEAGCYQNSNPSHFNLAAWLCLAAILYLLVGAMGHCHLKLHRWDEPIEPSFDQSLLKLFPICNNILVAVSSYP